MWRLQILLLQPKQIEIHIYSLAHYDVAVSHIFKSVKKLNLNIFKYFHISTFWYCENVIVPFHKIYAEFGNSYTPDECLLLCY